MFGVINVVMQGWTRNVFSRGVAGRGGAGQGQKPGQGRSLNLQSLFFLALLLLHRKAWEVNPKCILLLFVHQLITISTILLNLQGVKTTFFDVTL